MSHLPKEAPTGYSRSFGTAALPGSQEAQDCAAQPAPSFWDVRSVQKRAKTTGWGPHLSHGCKFSAWWPYFTEVWGDSKLIPPIQWVARLPWTTASTNLGEKKNTSMSPQ